MSERSSPFVEYKKKGQYGTSIRDATNEEMLEANERLALLTSMREQRQALTERIKKLEKGCTHAVSYDVAGFPYDHRFCYACGISRGAV
jgi:hypothetical protein